MTRSLAALMCLASVACSGPSDADRQVPVTPTGEQPPVAINPESPVIYPETLYEQGVEGEVVLQVWIDSSGRVAADSVWIAESSGHPALDSAALRAAPLLRYAPATRDGQPVSVHFLQPIQFRRPDQDPADGR